MGPHFNCHQISFYGSHKHVVNLGSDIKGIDFEMFVFYFVKQNWIKILSTTIKKNGNLG